MNPIRPAIPTLRFQAAQPKAEPSGKTVAELEALISGQTETGKSEDPFFNPNPFPEKPKQAAKKTVLSRLFGWLKPGPSQHRLTLDDKKLLDIMDRVRTEALSWLSQNKVPLEVKPLSTTTVNNGPFYYVDSNTIEDINKTKVHPTTIQINGKPYQLERSKGNYWTRRYSYSSDAWNEGVRQDFYRLTGKDVTITLDCRNTSLTYKNTKTYGETKSLDKVVIRQARQAFEDLIAAVREQQNYADRPLRTEDKLEL